MGAGETVLKRATARGRARGCEWVGDEECRGVVWGLESALLTEMAVVFVGNKLLED